MRLVMFRGRWHAIIGVGSDRKRVSLRTADRAEAERALAEIRREQAARIGGTVADIVAAYLDDRRATGRRVDTAEFSWRALAPVFGALSPGFVTRQLCRMYAAKRMEADIRPGTVARELSVLRAALRWQDKATPAVVELPSASQARESWITRAEFIALREAAVSHHLAVYLEVAKSTGARNGAILDLTWSRVDFEQGLIRLGADVGGKRRATVPMTDSLRAVLQAAREGARSPYVVEFAGNRVASVKTAFRLAARKIGRPDIGPHTIRKSVGRWMAEDGVSLPEIAEYLGHSNIEITRKHYAKFSPVFLRRAAGSLDF